MEIEMKYRVPGKGCADRIWEDKALSEICEADSRETIYMKAAYFDTADRILQKNDIAFRVRMEGVKTIATLKWNGSCVDGLHVREEINVPISGEDCLIRPTADIFKESEAGRVVMELTGGRPLENLLEIHFLRRRMRVDNGRSICEVAVDTGEIVTDYGKLPVCELEIELYSGEKEDVTAIGGELAEVYGLAAEDESKYFRGLQLIRNAAPVKE